MGKRALDKIDKNESERLYAIRLKNYISYLDMLKRMNFLTYKIYALYRLDTNEIFYIGLTIKSLKERLSQHFSEAKRCDNDTNKNAVVANLVKSGIGMGIQEICCFSSGKEYAHRVEIDYIEDYKRKGYNLTNGQKRFSSYKFRPTR